ncbi:cathepsin K [Anopheles sinensis]|uniref:Cathepsin K n=1 Tax=Anopheles sinensis TaxID=74873 RepID=A0A084WI15_ANOSI|nr:cathepsin K [Anopheles sinensis]
MQATIVNAVLTYVERNRPLVSSDTFPPVAEKENLRHFPDPPARRCWLELIYVVSTVSETTRFARFARFTVTV